MRLTILGGGGFRVPLVVRALRAPSAVGLVDEVVLHDVDAERLRAISNVVREIPGAGPRVGGTTSLDDALRGADVVFSAIRVGSAAGRVADEQVALDLGVLGQETTGAGGVAYALRTLPVATDVARRVAELAPSAWVVNFTNPAGMVTRAMGEVLGERVIGICDSPSGLVRRAALAAGLDPTAVRADYAGLNHLGWLRALWVGDANHLPALLANDGRLASFEEGRLFGPTLPRLLGALPNEYLFYYYCTREAVAAMRAAPATRGMTLAAAQAELYPALAGSSSGALELWEAARRSREEGYLAEARGSGEQRDEADLAGGGYEQVALAVMRAVLTGAPAELILNVRNGSALTQLPPDAVVEVPARVDSGGAHPFTLGPFDAHQLGLVSSMRAVEDATLLAARTGSRSAALQALTVHPLVDSARVAQALLGGYLAAHPQLRALLTKP
ncbi:6-phospho-beta-glucosidase [Angustibacter sp. McL0619]|uniref:family 4 glycosyl hydrolase n=1 Tax=Angustibacter sp. McL0619 TaxID=3415676 RepID=UPI003CEDD64F